MLKNYSKLTSTHRDSQQQLKKRIPNEKENIDSSNKNVRLASRQLDFGEKRTKPLTTIPMLQERKPFSITKRRDLDSLPYDIHLFIGGYLLPSDILKSLQYVNRYWNRVCNDRRLWIKLNSIRALPLTLKYAKKACIVERRSKGMIFKAVSRLTGEPVN